MNDLKNSAKQLIKKALFNSGLYHLNKLKNQCHIIMYHSVPDEPTGFYAEISKKDFDTHIGHLAANYTIISLSEFVHRVKTNTSLRGCVVITFDDGFMDNYTNAYPILKKYNAPATIFLLAGRVEDGKPPWFMKFRYSFMKTKQEQLDITIDGRSFDLPMTTPLQKKEASTRAMLYLQTLPDHKRMECLDIIEAYLAVTDYSELDNSMLTWDEIREMHDNKIEFGAHTINHPILSRLPFSKAEEEIAKSKYMVEEKLGHRINTFAYPFGKNDQYNADTIKILKKLSFDCSVTTEPGPANHTANLFETPRFFQGEVKLENFYWEPHS